VLMETGMYVLAGNVEGRNAPCPWLGRALHGLKSGRSTLTRKCRANEGPC
jgi:hypothetical protein